MDKEIKEEIIKRMKILNLSNQIINNFKNNNELYIFNLGGNPEKISIAEKSIVEKIEKEYNNIKVYCLIKYQNITYLLYIQENKKEWRKERQDLKNGYSEVIYVIKGNGTIGIWFDNTTKKITRVIDVK